MNESKNEVAPLWFTIVCALFLVWNFFGLAVFLMMMFLFNNEEALKNAEMNEEQIQLILSTPLWVNIAFGIAVIFGVVGSAALMIKRKLAVPVLALSLLGVLAQNTYIFFLSDTVRIMGVGASPMVIVGSFALVALAFFGNTKGWLR